MPIITLGGNVGAGKSHIASKLASALGYEEFNVSKFFRSMADKEGLTIDEFYSRLKNNPELERAIDRIQVQTLKEKDNMIVQGRLAWHFAKESPFQVFNVFLAVSPETMADRIAARPEYVSQSREELLRLAAAREAEERSRYQTLYGIENHLDRGHYDFVLDTTNLTPEEVVARILDGFRNRAQEA